jgi:hypothetical protein
MTTNIATEENVQDFIIPQGKDWVCQLELQNDDETAIDLTGGTFQGRARLSYGHPDIAFTFTFTPQSPLSSGIVDVSLPDDFYTTRMIQKQKFVYDWEFVDSGGRVHPISRGDITVIPEV